MDVRLVAHLDLGEAEAALAGVAGHEADRVVEDLDRQRGERPLGEVDGLAGGVPGLALRSASTGSSPSNRSRTAVMKRLRAPLVTWVSLMWSVVTGSSRVSSMRSPRASANAPVRQAVSRSPSTARAGRSSEVKVIWLP